MKLPQSFLQGWYRTLLQHPAYRWVVILGTLVYFISPIDLSPDVIPLLGQLDDVVLLTLLLSELFRMVSDRLMPTVAPPETEASQSQKNTAAHTVVDVDAVTLD